MTLLRVDFMTQPYDLWSNERLVGSLYLAKAARANPALSIAFTQPSLCGHQHVALIWQPPLSAVKNKFGSQKKRCFVVFS
jgi:hypothetical protein